MLNKSTCWSVLIYGLILFGLGLWAYLQAESRISLYMGTGSGALLIISAILMFAKNNSGAYGAIFLTAALTIMFAIRYSITNKPIPAILAVLSGAMLLFLLAQSVKWKK